MTTYFLYLYAILVFVILALGAVILSSRRKRISSLDLVLLSVRLPRNTEEKEKKQFLDEINLSEQILASFSSLQDPFALEVAVHNADEQIYFYIAIPKKSVDFAMHQIHGLYPEASVDVVPDYTIFGENGVALGMEMAIKDSFILPIRTYREAGVDTFSPVLSTLSGLDKVGQGASIQVVVSPHIPSGAKRLITDAMQSLRKGRPLASILKSYSAGIVGSFFEFFKDSSKESKKEGERPIVDEDAVKALQTKISKQLFGVNIRIVSSARTKSEAEDILLAVAGSFSQFASPSRNQIVAIKPASHKQKSLVVKYAFREFDPSTEIILNTEEIASLFHLPVSSTDIPRVQWLKTKEAPPPADVPAEGLMLGESIFRGDRRPIRITDDDRRRHLYIVGQTGTGKTVSMKNLIAQDMKNGKGLCVIDPHGDLIDDVLARVPENRLKDVIVFDPGDISRPLGMNMLEYDFNRPEQKNFIINEIQSIFNRLFSKESMGPMFEQYMRNALGLLMEDAKNEPATLMEVPRIFTDDGYRERKLKRISNPTIIDFWEKEAAKATGEWSLANMAAYVTSKFDNFISNDYIRPVIAQPKSAFNFRQIMDENKILLVNLSKGKIGDINSGLMGMIITGKLLMAALSRVDQDESARKDFYLYIDEFQNYTTDSISTILSEARKYRLNLVIAHQFISQLEDDIKDSVFGNVGSMLIFRVSAPDNEFLGKLLSPEFNEKDLLGLDVGNCVAKLLINGKPSRPFNVKVPMSEPGNNTLRDKLKELSRLTYGRDLAEVEREILARLRA